MKLWLVVIARVAACSKDDAGSSSDNMPAAAKAGPRDAVLDAWKTGGLALSAFAPETTPVGSDCARGKVGALDVLVCAYASPDAAKTAEAAAYRWVGDTTGSAQARGSVLIAVADRAKSDPNGKTINQLMKLAPK